MPDGPDPQRWDIGDEVRRFTYQHGSLHEITEDGAPFAWVEDEADARLVASAPELLRLLREALVSPMIDWEWYADNPEPDLQVQDDEWVAAQLTYEWLRTARTVLAQFADEEEGG